MDPSEDLDRLKREKASMTLLADLIFKRMALSDLNGVLTMKGRMHLYLLLPSYELVDRFNMSTRAVSS